MERLEELCKDMINRHEYQKCEKKLEEAMADNPHSAIPHNLMGILMGAKNEHILAMKHFRAAMSLEPGYLPACYNLEQFAEMVSPRIYAYTEKDCKMHDSPIKVIYGQNNIGYFERRK